MGKLSFGQVSKRASLEDISSENKMSYDASCELGARKLDASLALKVAAVRMAGIVYF